VKCGPNIVSPFVISFITTFIRRLHLLWGVWLLMWKIPHDLSKLPTPIKMLISIYFILLDYFKLYVASSLAHCYIFFAWGAQEEHLRDVVSVKPFNSSPKLLKWFSSVMWNEICLVNVISFHVSYIIYGSHKAEMKLQRYFKICCSFIRFILQLKYGPTISIWKKT
jgi:hypothetical protein